jgi:lysozyme family protein
LVAEARFETCLAEVLRHEGGFADHPDDPGGATNMGITRQTLAAWRGVTPASALPVAAVKTLRRAEAAQIYHRNYWKPLAGDELPAGLDLILFDFAVHSGPSRALKTLQSELGVRMDGIMGPLTLSGIRQRVLLQGDARLIDALCGRRLDFLQQLSSFAVFGKGWTKRVAAIRQAALEASGKRAAMPPQPRSNGMVFLNGYKTYLVAAFMLLAGLAQVLGLDLPNLEGSSAGHLIMEALAVLFLRKGLKANASQS